MGAKACDDSHKQAGNTRLKTIAKFNQCAAMDSPYQKDVSMGS